VSRHPLIQLSNDREVRQASEFRAAAEGLTGETLAVLYEQEVAGAPSRAEAGLPYFVPYNKRLTGSRRKNRDAEHLSLALLDHVKKHGKLGLPGGASFEPAAAQVHLATAAPDKSLGDDDPNKDLKNVDLVGLGDDDCLTIAMLKFVAPDATRPGVGETPLRGLLQTLALTANAWANREGLSREIEERLGRPASEDTPIMIVLASAQYWKLCRKREAQKGAAWIKEHERLAREIEEEVGVRVHYVSLELSGNPGWSYGDDSMPVLDREPVLSRSWEPGAGRLKPKPRPKASTEEAPTVEADLSRPVRPYALTEVYAAGDRIDHPTLGSGVVQGEAGPGKINVLFGERRSLLVHGRESASAASAL